MNSWRNSPALALTQICIMMVSIYSGPCGLDFVIWITFTVMCAYYLIFWNILVTDYQSLDKHLVELICSTRQETMNAPKNLSDFKNVCNMILFLHIKSINPESLEKIPNICEYRLLLADGEAHLYDYLFLSSRLSALQTFTFLYFFSKRVFILNASLILFRILDLNFYGFDSFF